MNPRALISSVWPSSMPRWSTSAMDWPPCTRCRTVLRTACANWNRPSSWIPTAASAPAMIQTSRTWPTTPALPNSSTPNPVRSWWTSLQHRRANVERRLTERWRVYNHTMKSQFGIAIMAAGKGTRLRSQRAKVLHEIGGLPLLQHVIRAASALAPAKDIHVIIGHQADAVRAAVKNSGVSFIEQKDQRGTGHA